MTHDSAQDHELDAVIRARQAQAPSGGADASGPPDRHRWVTDSDGFKWCVNCERRDRQRLQAEVAALTQRAEAAEQMVETVTQSAFDLLMCEKHPRPLTWGEWQDAGGLGCALCLTVELDQARDQLARAREVVEFAREHTKDDLYSSTPSVMWSLKQAVVRFDELAESAPGGEGGQGDG